MQTVRDDAGRRYLLLKRSAEACLVRDPDTDERRYIETERLTPIGQSPLVTAAEHISTETRRRLAVGPDERGVGLVSELDRRGPLAVRTLLVEYDVCESDLHGMLGELRAAGVVKETSVAGERGYRLTDAAQEILSA